MWSHRLLKVQVIKSTNYNFDKSNFVTHSKNKRKEVGYDKLVRVCDGCIKRDEFTVQVQHKPFGIQIGPLYGKTDDIGGIFVQSVKIGQEFERIELEEGLKFEKTVIIAIGAKKMENIELLPYNDAIEMLRTQSVPMYIRCKVEHINPLFCKGSLRMWNIEMDTVTFLQMPLTKIAGKIRDGMLERSGVQKIS